MCAVNEPSISRVHTAWTEYMCGMAVITVTILAYIVWQTPRLAWYTRIHGGHPRASLVEGKH